MGTSPLFLFLPPSPPRGRGIKGDGVEKRFFAAPSLRSGLRLRMTGRGRGIRRDGVTDL